MSYVDGFVISVPEDRLKDYVKMAKVAAKIWKEHGSLDYKECVADDVQVEVGVPFPKLAKSKPGEVVIFAYILYKSRAHRDKVNKLVMADPRMKCFMDDKTPPFDCKRMTYGGFKVLVDGQ